MDAYYDLTKWPVNFNVMEFLGAAVAYGANHVYFDATEGIRGKYSVEETNERLKSILLPCCRLMGVRYTFVTDKSALPTHHMIDPGCHVSALLDAYKATGRIGVIQQSYNRAARKSKRYTITLRQYDRYDFRNSDIPAWERFASQINAVIIPDYSEEKIPLETKVEFWANAEMNFFVNNGPAIMCYLSNIPYLSFFKWHDREYHIKHGFPEGAQFPWARKSQRILWETDSYDNLMRAFEQYCAKT
jgi:hypothetical protein